MEAHNASNEAQTRQYIYAVVTDGGRAKAAYFDADSAEDHADSIDGYVDRVILA